VTVAKRRAQRLAVVAFLFLGTCALYSRAATHDFVSLDDDDYVARNPRVLAGLSWEGVAWAFTTTAAANWHPLTWLSHMLDVELLGPSPGPHHVVNLLLHAANAVLLFLFLSRSTASTWRSALVAALFAVHPQHVESVAWISERKDLLSTLLGFGALLAYARHAERPAPLRYAAVALLFALSLLAKPMLVTLPFLLLLLDYWPLARFSEPGLRVEAEGPDRPRHGIRLLLAEKAPLLVLSALSSVATYRAQGGAGAIAPSEFVSLGYRLGNAAVSCANYFARTFWPVRLAAFYPHPGVDLSVWQAVACAAALAAATGAALAWRRRLPWLPVGWLWFLGTLVPVIGIVQVGSQGTADRYTYVPLVGVFVLLAWGGAALAGASSRRRGMLAAAAAVALLACGALTWRQVGVWSDTETLFRHAIAVTERNARAREILAEHLIVRGRAEEALGLAREALAVNPGRFPAWNLLSIALTRRGRPAEAAEAARRAVAIYPSSADGWSNLGLALQALGRYAEAREAFQRATAIEPADARRWTDLATVELSLGNPAAALQAAQEAARRDPSDAQWWFNLGAIHAMTGSTDAAIEAHRRATALSPGHARAWQSLGHLLERKGRSSEAAAAFEAAARAGRAGP
jgi:tetratricopeptide (TPR) repeat protein